MKWSSRLPDALRPIVASAVLIAGVRLADVAWRRAAGPGADGAPDGTPGDTPGDDGATTVRDRLVYAALLGLVSGLAGRIAPADTGRGARRRGRG